jgi:hypothetical protein
MTNISFIPQARISHDAFVHAMTLIEDIIALPATAPMVRARALAGEAATILRRGMK